MPKLKRNTSQVSDDAIYAMYDGPVPPSGVYPGVISSCYMSVSGNGNNMINVSGLFQTKGVEGKSKYDGFRIRGRIVIVDKEANMAREKAFYRAICGKEDVEIVFADMDKGDKPGYPPRGQTLFLLLPRRGQRRDFSRDLAGEDFAGERKIYPGAGLLTDHLDQLLDW